MESIISNLPLVMSDGEKVYFAHESVARPLLSILIPTILERSEQFEYLCAHLKNILDLHDLHDQVHVTAIRDNKEMPIGLKRQRLYDIAKGTYSWQIDDDDNIHQYAIPLILEAIEKGPDCVTFEEKVIIDGVEKRSNFSLKYVDWGEKQDGYDYVRTPFFKTPILTSICQQVPVPPTRFGEDHAWSRLVKPLLTTEVHIPKPLYYYQHTSSPFTERYGFHKDFDVSENK